jgi:hypothetical protein
MALSMTFTSPSERQSCSAMMATMRSRPASEVVDDVEHGFGEAHGGAGTLRIGHHVSTCRFSPRVPAVMSVHSALGFSRTFRGARDQLAPVGNVLVDELLLGLR